MSREKARKMELFSGKNLLDVDEVARILNVSPSTVRGWVFERRIPFIKFGRGQRALVKFNPVVLNQWIEENSVQPRSKEERSGEVKTLPDLKRASHKTVKGFDDFVRSLKP
jgi:excisionase family DNA binding protein